MGKVTTIPRHKLANCLPHRLYLSYIGYTRNNLSMADNVSQMNLQSASCPMKAQPQGCHAGCRCTATCKCRRSFVSKPHHNVRPQVRLTAAACSSSDNCCCRKDGCGGKL